VQPTPAAGPLPGAPAKSPGLTHRINVNTAGQAELELLPNVGPAMAKKIMDYRALHGPFKSIADLDKVKGIGPKTMAKIAPLVTVE
jgi:competence protein ComEA